MAGLLVASGLAGCGGGDATDADATATSGGSGASSSGGGTTSAYPTPPPDISVSETIIEITFINGVVSPEAGEVAVPLGNTVRSFVTADAAEEVHVHGYELTLELVAGVPAELTFVADVPGIFEVELHESEQLLFELRVE